MSEAELYMERLKRICRNRIVIGILALYGIFAVVLLGTTVADLKKFPEVFRAPDFRMQDIFGAGDVALGDYSGRPVIIYFFASW